MNIRPSSKKQSPQGDAGEVVRLSTEQQKAEKHTSSAVAAWSDQDDQVKGRAI